MPFLYVSNDWVEVFERLARITSNPSFDKLSIDLHCVNMVYIMVDT